MSAAEPMGDERRRASYGVTGYRWPTPRQARRMRHKERKGKYGYGYPGTKGYATWPRARVRAAVLASRRRAEAAKAEREAAEREALNEFISSRLAGYADAAVTAGRAAGDYTVDLDTGQVVSRG